MEAYDLAHILRFINNMGISLRKKRIFVLSFFLPVLILALGYICRGVFPFGKWDVLLIDLYHQYAPFLSDLRDKLLSFSSLLYSWSGGLGTSYLPQFAYYLSSPLNLLIVLFPEGDLTEAILILILLKIGLSGLFFCICLKGIYGDESIVTAGFSLLYALSGYVMAYSWNIMWLDAVYLLPLVILGLVKLIRDGKSVLYCVSLTLVLISNFYIAFFVCLFVLLYFPLCLFKYQILKKPGALLKTTLRTGLFSLLSAGMSAVLLLPTYFSLKLTSAAKDIFPKEITHYYDLFDYISRHFVMLNPTIREGMPNMYCGMIVLILLPVYFLSRRIRTGEKILHFSLLAVLIASFNTNTLNFIWHGFHFPNQLPYRFSFVYIFLLLLVCYEGYKNLDEFSGKQIGTFCFIIAVLIVLSQKLDKKPTEIIVVYVSLAFVVIYAAVMTLGRASEFNPKSKAVVLLLIFILEIGTNTIMSIVNISISEGYTIRDGYASGAEVAQMREELSKIAPSGNSFYRTEVYPPKTTNDPCLYNYYGLTIFSSTFPMKPVKLMENLGYHSNGINSFKYEGSTPFLDSLFGIRYLLYRTINIDERLYRKISSTDEVTVFENPYALPLGFWAPSEIKNWRSGSGNPFDIQNNLMKQLGGTGNIFVQLEQKQGYHSNISMSSTASRYYSFTRPNTGSKSTVRVQVLNDKDQQVYLYFDITTDFIESGFVTVDGNKVEFNANRSTLVNLGFCKAGGLIELELTLEESAPESGSFRLYSYALDSETFERGIDEIKQGALDIEKFSDTHITGTIRAESDGVAVITIPFDKGWNVRVDNKEVETAAIDDGLLCFEITEGLHQIELTFIPEMFMPGLLLSAVSLLAFLMICLRQAAKNKKLPLTDIEASAEYSLETHGRSEE